MGMVRTNLSDEEPEPVQVTIALRADPQLADSLVEFLSSLIRVFLVSVGVMFFEVAPVLMRRRGSVTESAEQSAADSSSRQHSP